MARINNIESQTSSNGSTTVNYENLIDKGQCVFVSSSCRGLIKHFNTFYYLTHHMEDTLNAFLLRYIIIERFRTRIKVNNWVSFYSPVDARYEVIVNLHSHLVDDGVARVARPILVLKCASQDDDDDER